MATKTIPEGWKWISDYCIRSHCTRFTVCKYGIGDGEFRYEAWKGKDHLKAGMSTAAAAIRVCEKHGFTWNSSVQAHGPKSSPSQAGDQAAQLSFTEVA